MVVASGQNAFYLVYAYLCRLCALPVQYCGKYASLSGFLTVPCYYICTKCSQARKRQLAQTEVLPPRCKKHSQGNTLTSPPTHSKGCLHREHNNALSFAAQPFLISAVTLCVASIGHAGFKSKCNETRPTLHPSLRLLLRLTI